MKICFRNVINFRQRNLLTFERSRCKLHHRSQKDKANFHWMFYDQKTKLRLSWFNFLGKDVFD